ncbi:MAG TPA: RidA family protein [Pyrinomonadaceae bacterium]|jgi:enamine deaminase RidA (YjgF/YER057c/UK114 family)
MEIRKESETFNLQWENEYGYSQAIKVGDTIYLAGQVSHDETGNIIGEGDMEAQLRQAYINVQNLLARYGATMHNVVDEVLFVTDMEAAFAARVNLGQTIFDGAPVVASTIVQIERLAFPELMIEIKCVAKV